MKNIFLASLLMVVGCVSPVQLESSSDDSSDSTDIDQINLVHYGPRDKPACPSYRQTLLGANGKRSHIYIPAYCVPGQMDKGDPPPDEEVSVDGISDPNPIEDQKIIVQQYAR